MKMTGRKDIFGCFSHLMEKIEEDDFMFSLLDDKYKPHKELHYCYMCKNTMRVLK